MSIKHSLNGPSILNIQSLINSVVPGLERIMSVYFCTETSDLKAILTDNPDENKMEEISIPEKSFFEDLMRKKSTFTWHQKSELPFHIPKRIEKQIDMFAFKDVVLLIRISGFKDNAYDLLFLYFKENINYFGLRRGNKGLDVENKTIIGTILYNTINTIIKKDAEFSSASSKNSEVMRSILERTRDQRKEYYSTLEMYERSIIDLSQKYLSDLSAEKDLDFRLTDGAILALKKYSGDISKLKQIIEKAAYEAEILNFAVNAKKIIIDEYFLDLMVKAEEIITDDTSLNKEDRYYKTHNLLDKLETAVSKLKDNNISITGANVGKVCPVPITAPAISDAMKKHRRKIIKLMHDNPDNWLLLRSEFRPLKNILVSQNAMGA